MRARSLGRFKCLRLVLAYVLALQTLLGVWAGAAQAGGSPSFGSALCRTMAPGEAPPADGEQGLPAHCVIMCLSGACGSTEPPAALVLTADFPPSLDALAPAFILPRPSLSSIAGSGLHARGPPSIG